MDDENIVEKLKSIDASLTVIIFILIFLTCHTCDINRNISRIADSIENIETKIPEKKIKEKVSE